MESEEESFWLDVFTVMAVCAFPVDRMPWSLEDRV